MVMKSLRRVQQLLFDFTHVILLYIQALGSNFVFFCTVVSTIRVFFIQHLIDIILDGVCASRGACEGAFSPAMFLEELVEFAQVRYPQLTRVWLLIYRFETTRSRPSIMPASNKCLTSILLLKSLLIWATYRAATLTIIQNHSVNVGQRCCSDSTMHRRS